MKIVREVLTDMIEDRLRESESDTEELKEAWKLCAALVIGVIKDSATMVGTDSTAAVSTLGFDESSFIKEKIIRIYKHFQNAFYLTFFCK